MPEWRPLGNVQANWEAALSAEAAARLAAEAAEDVEDTAESVEREMAEATIATNVASGVTSLAAETAARVAADLTKQPLDADLTDIAALLPANDDVLQRKSGTWTNRTIAQLKLDLAITAADSAETDARVAGDAALSASLATEVTNRIADVDVEESARIAAVSSEAATRAAADTTLSTSLSSEVTNRTTADTNETNARIAADATKQPLDSDLTAIAAIASANDDFIQRKSGVWVNRTMAQLKADLSLVADTSASLAAELAARIAADAAVQANIDAAIAARVAADSTLTTNLAAVDTSAVHKAGTETITGSKTFSALVAGSIDGNAATVTTNANLTGDVTSVGNATTIPSLANKAVTNPTITGGTLAGSTITGSSVDSTALSVSGILAQKAFALSFTAGSANQKADLYFTTPSGSPLNGQLTVSVVSSVGGMVEKRYALALETSVSTYNISRYSEVMNQTPVNVAISNLTWDATNARWKIQVQHRLTTALACTIAVQFQSSSADAVILLSSFDVGSVYTTDTTVPADPIVTYEKLFVTQGVTSTFVNTLAGGSYNIGPLDSIILAGSGATVKLPVASANNGRLYIVKNIGTSGVTVQSFGGTIDAAASYTVGNRGYNSFLSDGGNWWVVS